MDHPNVVNVELHNRVSKLATIVDDKTVITQLIRENSTRIKLNEFKDARADIWQFFRLVCIDGQTLPYAVCIRCLKPVSYKAREGTGGLHRHPCSKQNAALAMGAQNSSNNNNRTKSKRTTASGSRQTKSPSAVGSPNWPVNRLPNLRTNLTLDQFSAIANNLPKMSSLGFPINTFEPSLAVGFNNNNNSLNSTSAGHDLPTEMIKLFCCELLPLEVLESGSFLRLAQQLINFGAAHGAVSFDQMQVKTLVDNAYEMAKQSAKEELMKQRHATVVVDVWSGDSDKRLATTWTHRHTVTGDCPLLAVATRDVSCVQTLQQLLDEMDLVGRDWFGGQKNCTYLLENGFQQLLGQGQQDVLRRDDVLVCINHQLQHIVDSLWSTPELVQLRSDVKALVTQLKSSEQTTDDNSLVTQLSELVADRNWHRQVEALRLLEQHWDTLTPLVTDSSSGLQLSVVCEVATLLQAVEEAFSYLFMEQKQLPTINLVVLCKVKLENHCKASDADSPLLRQLKKRVQAAIDCSQLNHPIYLMAVCLDPRFKKLKMLPEESRRNTYQCIRLALVEEAEETREEVRHPAMVVETVISEHSDEEQQLEVEAPTKRIKTNGDAISQVFNEFLDESDDRDRDELDRYLSVDVGQSMQPTEFWAGQHGQRLPRLKRLADRLLSIPAAPLKCCQLTDSGRQLCARRAALRQPHADKLLTLHSYFV